MLTRFWGAILSSAPVTNTGGVLGGLFTPAYRGLAMAVTGGPTIGPIVSAAIVIQPWIAPVGLFLGGAMAANTFLRSCFAAMFPLIISPLYHNTSVGPGSSVFAGFATLLVPVPFAFHVFGGRIRAASKWSMADVF
ncbi:hypothetical protein HD806DRAFT_529746 [Xylariaceae sp. AK1471]|nr:hypothetical protein HD806DRAFT_529746 [Xylariaceae sp. AK1471]